MKVKKIIGWVLAFLGVALFIGILVEQHGLKKTMMACGFTLLVISFIALVLWLIMDDL